MTRPTAYRTTIAFLAGIGAAGAAGFARSLVVGDFVGSPLAANYVTMPLAAVLGALFVGVTLVFTARAPKAGGLLVLAAAAIGLGFWRFSDRRWPAVLGLAVTLASGLLPVFAVTAHGDGRGRAATRVLVAGEVVLITLAAAIVFSAPDGALASWHVAANPRQHVLNPATIVESAAFARVCLTLWWVTVVTCAAVAIGARIARWRREPVRARSIGAPVVVAAIIWLAIALFAAAVSRLDAEPVLRASIVSYANVALPSIALAIVAGTLGWAELIRPRLDRAVSGPVELRQVVPADHAGLNRMLGDALATRDLDVVFARDGEWFDARGIATTLTADRRQATTITRDGEPIAAVRHDPEIPASAIELAARLAAGQFDAQRAAALAEAKARAARDAAGSLVRAGDRAAAAVSDALAAGPVTDLRALASEFRSDPASVEGVARTLQAVTAEVREISHGLYPRELTEEGLAVLGRSTSGLRRFVPAIETTLYLLLRDDPDATITDYGSSIVVARARPLPPDVAERVAILDGTIATTANGTVVSLVTAED